MLLKEDLIHKSDQPVLNPPKWIKKLTMILTSVLLLTMFGLGGYWVGARQQQSSPPHLLTKPGFGYSTDKVIEFLGTLWKML
jgi:hypothetical protein